MQGLACVHGSVFCYCKSDRFVWNVALEQQLARRDVASFRQAFECSQLEISGAYDVPVLRYGRREKRLREVLRERRQKVGQKRTAEGK